MLFCHQEQISVVGIVRLCNCVTVILKCTFSTKLSCLTLLSERKFNTGLNVYLSNNSYIWVYMIGLLFYDPGDPSPNPQSGKSNQHFFIILFSLLPITPKQVLFFMHSPFINWNHLQCIYISTGPPNPAFRDNTDRTENKKCSLITSVHNNMQVSITSGS